jgi:hypothetical protein
MTFDEAWFYISIFLLIMNHFDSVQKTRLYKGRTISEDDANECPKPTQISFDWYPTKG